MAARSIDWGSLLLEYRRTRNLKQEALARDLGVSQASISRWESGASQPPAAVRNLLFRAARRERSPIDMLNWIETFKRIPVVGGVLMPNRANKIVTARMARLWDLPAEEIEGTPVHELFRGSVLENDAGVVRAGFFFGGLASYESISRVELNPSVARRKGVWSHQIGWPYFCDDGTILRVWQSTTVSRETAAEIKTKLGGSLRIVNA
jgi:transcriptional regulator with XRE-family HTH domain